MLRFVSWHDAPRDAWGIAEGFHDIDGDWHPTTDAARAAVRAAMGPLGDPPPFWIVRPGEDHHLWGPCRLVLEGGADLGVVHRLPDDLPLGYHDLVPTDGGPVTRLACAPRACPPPPQGWGVASQLYATWTRESQGIGDLRDLATLARWVAGAGGAAILLSPLHAPAPVHPQLDSPYSPATRRWRNPLHLHAHDLPASLGTLVDRDSVWRAKRPALRAEFLDRRAEPGFAAWRQRIGDGVTRWARWCAAQEGTDDAPFHEWLQFRFDEQLAAVRDAAPGVALIGDLAIGFDPDGFDAADFAPALAHGCRVGAPPDAFNAEGQDWGLPPFVPHRLRLMRYSPFIETIRGALRGMQGLRIDHVMGLFRQYWIPPDASPREGAYVRFPAGDMLALLALEATRAGAFVIGEDLGTVEDGVRESLDAHGVAGTKVAWFSAEAPAAWPELALATLSTHDLPTIAGVWTGEDGDADLLRLLQLRAGVTVDAGVDEVVVAAHRALAEAPCALRLATLDDLARSRERPNVPGTTWERPNWRIPLPGPLEELRDDPVVGAAIAAMGRHDVPGDA